MSEFRRRVASVLAVLFVVLVTACATGPGGPEEEGPPLGSGRGGRGMGPGQPREHDAWKQYDVNGDGKVARAEFMAAQGLCFLRYDANEDGILTPAEVRRRVPGRLADGFGPMMARVDRDRDGEINREEFHRDSDRLFQFADTNGDGIIAGMELTALASGLPGDLCQSSGPSDSGGKKGVGAPQGGPGPRTRP